MSETAQNPESLNKFYASSVFKGIADLIGVESVSAALNTRYELIDPDEVATVIDIGDSQLTVGRNEVYFVNGEWQGKLSMQEVASVMDEYLEESGA